MGVSTHCQAQDSPVLKVYAYERGVVGGIPGGPGPGPGPTAAGAERRYIIYLETPPTARFTVEGVWIGEQYHAVETAVRKAPVRFESPVKLADAEADVAVPATTNTVTEIVVKDPLPARQPDGNVTRMLREGRAAVALTYQGSSVLVPVAAFQKRDPLYLP